MKQQNTAPCVKITVPFPTCVVAGAGLIWGWHGTAAGRRVSTAAAAFIRAGTGAAIRVRLVVEPSRELSAPSNFQGAVYGAGSASGLCRAAFLIVSQIRRLDFGHALW